jgi:cell fate (sporulation/competence/biofilm development) regulator YlbF (YheA/YmcA/DUF963 family)
LLNEKGEYARIISHSDNSDIQRWIDWLSISPTDADGILRMLDSPEPPIRWLGLKKVSTMDELSDIIVAKLENIVRTDDYVRIVHKSDFDGIGQYLPHNGTTCPDSRWCPICAGGSDFKCPLREYAVTVLQKLGKHDVTMDDYQVALRGIAYLNELIEMGKDSDRIARELWRRSVEYNVGNGGKLWKEIVEQRDKYPQFSALYKAWDEWMILYQETMRKSQEAGRKAWEELAATKPEQMRSWIAEGKMIPTYMTKEEALQVIEKYTTLKTSSPVIASEAKQSSAKNEGDETKVSPPNRMWFYVGGDVVLCLGAVFYVVRKNLRKSA